MKMVEEFARIIAKVVLLRETKKHIEAKTELDNLSKLISGLSVYSLRTLGAQGIVYAFSLNKESYAEKIHCAARILKEDAAMLEAEGKTEDSLRSFKISEELFKMISADETLKDMEVLK